MTVAMTAAMAMTSAAAAVNSTEDAGTGTIIIENPISGQAYNAFKIFDVTYSGNSYAYTIASDSVWYHTVAEYAGESGNGLTLTAAADGSTDTNYIVQVNADFRAAMFSAALKDAMTFETGESEAEMELAELIADTAAVFKMTDGEMKTESLELGYYFVTSANGALCNLTTTDPLVVIYDKNDILFEKTDDASSAEIGQTVNYCIEGKVPDTTGFDTYTYIITDTMSEGLTFLADVAVYIGEYDDSAANNTVLSTDYYDLEMNETGFVLDISVEHEDVQEQYKNQQITVVYSAKVNEHAVCRVENNRAVLEYTNAPDGGTTSTPAQEETIYSAKIHIDKFYKAIENEEETEHALAGAQFVLYKKVQQTDAEGRPVTDGDGNPIYNLKYYSYDGTSVSWKSTVEEADVKITNEEGDAEFIGLADGTYYLLETKAPDGYNLLKEAVEVIVDGSDVLTAGVNAGQWESFLMDVTKVENNSGSLLPSTGGTGTTIFYILGSLLTCSSGLFFVIRKRMEQEKSSSYE